MKKQPKSIKSVRKIKRKQSKLIEGPKKTLLIRGNKTSNSVLSFMKNIRAFRKERAVFYSHKHELLPFEDKTLLQKYCEKSESSLFLFGSHSKKRPNNIIIGRTYENKVLDMVEFGLNNFKAIEQISSVSDIPYQVRPFLIFQGDVWETDQECNKIRNLLTDFFFENDKIKGIDVDKIIQIVISFSVFEDKRIYMRVYEAKVEGKNLFEDDGKIVVEELGPNAELTIRRTSFADSQTWSKATYIPKPKKKKQNKNVKYDSLGNKRGKLYMDRQDLNRVETKKRKLIRKDKKSASKVESLPEKMENQFAAK